MPKDVSKSGSKRFKEDDAMNDANVVRLRLVMALFRIRPVDLSKGKVGYSKGYISGILSGTLKPSSDFFVKLNSCLLDLISQAGAASSVFDVPPINIDDRQAAVDEMLKSA